MAYLNFADPDFRMLATLGRILGVTRVTGLGYNPSIDTATVPEDIWTNGGIYPWPAGATMFELGYLAGGDVGRVIRVSGIDYETKDIITEDVTTNGTTFVALTKPFYRINRMTNISAGVNPNDVILRRVVGGTVQAVIPAGIGVTLQSQYSVPRLHTLLMFSVDFSINADSGINARSADAALFLQNSVGAITMPLRITASTFTSKQLPVFTTIPILAEQDFQLRCVYCSANATIITGAWEGYLIRD